MNTRATINIIATFENSIAQAKRVLPDIHGEFQLKLNSISREVDNYILTTDKLLRISDDLHYRAKNCSAKPALRIRDRCALRRQSPCFISR
ncbi:hypothetical protein GGS24DRAFT_454241 [Hypoxylon argillaceum]|nr:hypothetical protein GGS24DRAFT_454241 [Hypoxylon argillaceum]